jgi:hypothetical protein
MQVIMVTGAYRVIEVGTGEILVAGYFQGKLSDLKGWKQ